MTMEEGARIVVERWLMAQPEDVLHFITDETKLREAYAFERACEISGAVPKISVLPSDSVQSGDSIEEMRHIMSYATAIVGATNYSFITTNAVRYALKHGARFLSIPLSTTDGTSLLEQEFLRMSPRRAQKLAQPLLSALKKANVLHITTAAGTDLTLHVKGRRPGLFNGQASRPGVCASASFEVYIPPVETSAEGVLVLDGSMGYIGAVTEPLTLRFHKGKLCELPVERRSGRELAAFLSGFRNDKMYCAAEFGLGLNEYSKCRGVSYIEDESAYGTCHIGFGRNLALGGVLDAPGHFDVVVMAPTVYADGVEIMKQGEIVKPRLFRKT